MSSPVVSARVAAWSTAAAVLGLALVVVLVVTAGGAPYADLGNSDPGALVRLGTPLLRFVVDVAATLGTGSLVFAACFTEPGSGGRLSAGGYSAVRWAGRWALVWLVAVLVLVPFDVADTTGQGLPEVLPAGHFFGLLSALEEPRAWLVTAVVVLVVAVGTRMTLRWPTTVALALLSVFALLPPLATGHSSSDAGHDFATTALLIHVPAAAVWLGTLAALLGYAVRTGAVPVVLGRRYARLATGCWLVLVATGVVDALVLAPVGQWWSTTYGVLVLAEVAVAVLLGVVVTRWRRRVLDAVVSVGRLARLAGAELVLLVGAVALAVGQTHLPPPAFVGHPVTPDQTLLGYDLAGPPTWARLAGDWRIDVLFGPLAVLLAVAYLVGVRRLPRRWPVARTVSWLAGCAVMLIATSSGVGRYAPAMFSMHMASHMLLTMLAPVLLVLGAPLTLLAAAVPAGGGGPVDVLRAVYRSPVARALTHPVVVLALFAGSPFALYFTGLFDAAVRFHWAHTAIAVWFFFVGVLFAWVVVGVDPLPRRMPNLARLGMLLAAMPTDTVFAAMVMTTHTVIGNGPAGDNQYRALALPWVHSLLADQHAGGLIALIVTEASLMLAIVFLLIRWSATEYATDATTERDILTQLRQRVAAR
ncbi:MAG TPA: cytochrome c oxidase assembly protein [Pseudonocardiaceae bacterium]|nr:cytochrome c oxidase assembly protein [Pseudonocardiaceae bacterium]